mmetsp:Transcript_22269/g.27297  ORF Transcript_22269/g.27297 Transcript_22269/m.27297 type:complete len:127 (+) Transcript_22269:298-678(+)
MNGIAQVVVGYTGGKMPDPTYQNIKDATEAVLVEFDPVVISYEEILNEWTQQHHPFMKQQTQYRSAIFVKNEAEREIAEKVVKGLGDSNGLTVYTDIEDVGAFYRAEEYHQDFLNKQKSSRAFNPY